MKRHDMMMDAPAAMGHAGHAGMSMDAGAVQDMRNRFLVAAVLSVPILLWSPIGRQVPHFGVPAPFGLRDDVFQLVLSLPVIAYSGAFFFHDKRCVCSSVTSGSPLVSVPVLSMTTTWTAVRALLNLSPPQAIVIRDGAQVEVPTAEVQVGDLLLVKPGAKVREPRSRSRMHS